MQSLYQTYCIPLLPWYISPIMIFVRYWKNILQGQYLQVVLIEKKIFIRGNPRFYDHKVFQVSSIDLMRFYTDCNLNTFPRYFYRMILTLRKKSKADNLIDLYQKPSRTLSKSFTQTLLHDPKKRPPFCQ